MGDETTGDRHTKERSLGRRVCFTLSFDGGGSGAASGGGRGARGARGARDAPHHCHFFFALDCAAATFLLLLLLLLAQFLLCKRFKKEKGTCKRPLLEGWLQLGSWKPAVVGGGSGGGSRDGVIERESQKKKEGKKANIKIKAKETKMRKAYLGTYVLVVSQVSQLHCLLPYGSACKT